MATRKTKSRRGFSPLRFHYKRLTFELGVRVRCFGYGTVAGLLALPVVQYGVLPALGVYGS